MSEKVPADCKRIDKIITNIRNSDKQLGYSDQRIVNDITTEVDLNSLSSDELNFLNGSIIDMMNNTDTESRPKNSKSDSNLHIKTVNNSDTNSNQSSDSDSSINSDTGDKSADKKINFITHESNNKTIAKKYHMNPNDVIDYTSGDGEKELNEMIGLKPIKKQLREFIIGAMFHKRARQLGQDDKNISSDNMIFMGNPGTGKTVVARLTGKILFQHHVIKKPLLYECSSKNFISPLVGGSAIAANKAVKRALGGILFIDEAYELAPSKDNSNTSKGSAVSELLRSTENHFNKNPDDNVIIILAGYKDKMQNLIAKSNEGLRSRFSHPIDFPDYSDDEMVEILKFMAKKNHRNIDAVDQPDIKNDVIKFVHLARLCGDNSNARTMRNLLDAINEAHQLRVSGNDLSKIEQLSLPEIDDMSAQDIQNGVIQASNSEKEKF